MPPLILPEIAQHLSLRVAIDIGGHREVRRGRGGEIVEVDELHRGPWPPGPAAASPPRDPPARTKWTIMIATSPCWSMTARSTLARSRAFTWAKRQTPAGAPARRERAGTRGTAARRVSPSGPRGMLRLHARVARSRWRERVRVGGPCHRRCSRGLASAALAVIQVANQSPQSPCRPHWPHRSRKMLTEVLKNGTGIRGGVPVEPACERGTL